MIAYVINPGTASTKLALAHIQPSDNPSLPGNIRVELEKREVVHPDLPGPLIEKLPLIRQEIWQGIKGWPRPDAVVGRGGILGPLPAGTYRVTQELADFAMHSPYRDHITNLGAPLALEVAKAYGVEAYVVDPMSVDELLPEARISGFPGAERTSVFHALNAKAVARRTAYEVGKRFTDSVIVVAHLGNKSSITTYRKGRAIDTTGAHLEEGPFTPSATGMLPLSKLLDLAYQYPRERVEQMLLFSAGFKGLTGTADLKELEQRQDDPQVKLAVKAFVYQVAKYIGAYSVVAGRPDAIAITGGIARWFSLVDLIEEKLSWIAPVVVIPGELELEALGEGVGRVLVGHEQPKEWVKP
ncbi:butyrate kinase [Deinococcus roseus]|uniref:Probable butyrate kinase n=1 Tax=Deinococcus roseus TaxID=392414 RepID=A0ABQ2D5E6_9DEIO|nr:butyrate kinase [Deinococcus roseus]GGJ45258.1 putative butyrate kinase [Deinococcus roseus]